MCAFTIIPSVSLAGTEAKIEVSYLEAVLTDNIMTVNLSYGNNEQPFEIIRDIVVSTDSDFEDVLELERCTVEDNRYIYTFSATNKENIESVYIKPPVLYAPGNIDDVVVKVAENEVAKTDNDENWFAITDIQVVKGNEDEFFLSVVLEPNTDSLPRNPELIIGDKVYPGNTAMKFDAEGNFTMGQFVFILPTTSLETLSKQISNESLEALDGDLTIRVNDVLHRVEASKKVFPDVRTLTVINNTVVK